jgi:predicted GNAT family acetyltransferase
MTDAAFSEKFGVHKKRVKHPNYPECETDLWWIVKYTSEWDQEKAEELMKGGEDEGVMSPYVRVWDLRKPGVNSGALSIDHTWTPVNLRGMGLGEEVVRAVETFAKLHVSGDFHVEATCSYAQKVLSKVAK